MKELNDFIKKFSYTRNNVIVVLLFDVKVDLFQWSTNFFLKKPLGEQLKIKF